jgi:dipeptidyl aminopeptidase/acylaminoacyl peptidase
MLLAMRVPARLIATAAIGLGLSISSLAAQTAHFPSSEDLRHIRAMSQPRLSPDGQSVLVQITDATADGGKSHIWLVDRKPNSSRQLTYSPAADKADKKEDHDKGEHTAEWMPDGASVLFLAKRGEHTQLFRLPMQGGEAHPYDLKILPPVDESTAADAIPPRKADATAPKPEPPKPEPIEIDVESYSISPDGRTIAITAKDPETPGEKKQHDEKADALWVDHDPHGARLYLMDAESGKLTPTAVPPDVKHAFWTRQGDRLMAITEGMNDAGDLAPASAAWLLSPGDPTHPSQVKPIPSTIDTGAWSPDGSRFYFLAQSQNDAPPGYHDLYAFTPTTQSTQNLSSDFNGSLGHDAPLPDGDAVLQTVQTGTRVTLVRFDANHHETLPFDMPVVTQLNTNAKHTGWVWLATSSTQPVTLYYSEALGRSATQLKTPNLLPASWTPVPSQVVQWKSDAFTIEGLLYLPPHIATGKVPLIVDVHGGPTGAFEDSYAAFTNFLVGQGWAVLRPNPRGSTGYGRAFAAANKRDLGGGDYRDIMAGVDAVLAKYPLDANRLGLMGYSYGGEMAGFVEGRTDRFKAIVSGAPVIDQQSEYGTEDSSWYDRWFYGGRPWERAEDAWRQSPLANAAHAKTPFLLIQGEDDKTDPLGQSLEMYRALRQMGVPVEFVKYPREDHGPLAIGIFGAPSPEPWHGFDGRQRIVKFFQKAFAQ